MEALDAPYMQIGFWRMVKKRAGWLAVLFLGEMLTATAMGHSGIARAHEDAEHAANVDRHGRAPHTIICEQARASQTCAVHRKTEVAARVECGGRGID